MFISKVDLGTLSYTEKMELCEPLSGSFEKNWGSFIHNKKLHMLYDINPLKIFELDDDFKCKLKINVNDKILKKFKKEFEGRWVAFGTYDINYPGGATHWVGVSGKNDNDHIILYDELQKNPEFIKLAGERGKIENVKDYMVNNIKSY